jgi:hypothetical protein
VLAARKAAEAASSAALEGLGVFVDRRPEHLDAAAGELRVGLRARCRQLESDRALLVAECAYEQWHRLLFARFLAENQLLLHPEFRAPVTLADCEDLAPELGEPDGWSVAARFAAEILPGIFRLDDPCVRLRLAPEGRHELEAILDEIPASMFAASDALGWVYQFWQKDKKDEINGSARKIGGADLGPVTQLFTENYMVRFLLENTLGAWWAGRHPESPLVGEFEYLSRGPDGGPASRNFAGWPDSVAEVTVIDPCCGSGHFLVEAFSLLWRMRVEECGETPVEAQDAVLRDNLFGLELDPRCVQIAMFALALQAWRNGKGWRRLPSPSVSCAGIPVKAEVDDWRSLAKGDERIEGALTRLHRLFREADTFGSLIDPRHESMGGDPAVADPTLEDVDWEQLAPLLTRGIAREAADDPAAEVLGADAEDLVHAADLLSREYSLVVTNVPYLGRIKQSKALADLLERRYRLGRADLAVAFLLRLAQLAGHDGVFAAVTPVSWMFLRSYEGFRKRLLSVHSPSLAVRLGAGAFDQISGEVVNVALLVASVAHPAEDATVGYIDCDEEVGAVAKAHGLRTGVPVEVTLRSQLENPRAIFNGLGSDGRPLLGRLATAYQGTSTGDAPRFLRKFWELGTISDHWRFQQGTADATAPYTGRENVIHWQGGRGELHRAVLEGAGAIRGESAWGRKGVALTQMGSKACTLYDGDLFDNSSTAVIPNRAADIPALYHFLSSEEFHRALRNVSPKMAVEVDTVTAVPIDIDHWREVAAAAGPLPEPGSNDPTQWLFDGRPETSAAPLQVAVARLVGYEWPAQEDDDLDALADEDGIVCLPSVTTEAPAADRLERLLTQAFGTTWSPTRTRELLEEAGSRKRTLAEWLRYEFFRQHCATFGNRPFVWQVWDGRKDGFSALINYHRLDRPLLEKLTFTYLGQDWIERQRAEIADGIEGAEGRLAAAQELRQTLGAILLGEPPLDIYARWRAPREQPRGWEPNLEDGVRVNIRPFVESGALRSRFAIHWRKDRGRNSDGSERRNDIHLTEAEKTEPVQAG